MHALAARTVLSRSAMLLALALACGEGGAVSTTSTGTDSSDGTTQAATGTTGATGESSTTTAPTTGAASTSTTGSTGNGGTTGTTDSGETATTGGSSTGLTTTGTTDPGTSATDTTDGTTGTTDGTTSSTSSTGSGTDGTTGGLGELGVLSGDCGLIDAMELNSPEPFVFSGAIDFGVVGYDYELLTPGGQQIYDEGNLNPGSLYSEIVAYEVLARCDMASLLKTEATIVYQNPMGKKTDLLVELDGLKVGVSVVRAVGFPFDDPYTVDQADAILTKKLGDILLSTANVAPEDAWVKQILSVVAYGPMHLDSVLAAYAALSPDLKADTILVVTVTDGDDAFIY